ncbi:glucan endo-1,3-beta-glucosidase-like isoform X1 [Rhodamnia argentea]|uniref:Glucan endo-1,3-beta-glucosidase-like isoform X1 n=1 Tax=Rhodamnia argentea TaxID=178133 RepID=A0ABM3HNP7_9MYRT|nr:glucan endo-1,3-beta-glucosidase-like isoform X1 [Rhodamnia argentea]
MIMAKKVGLGHWLLLMQVQYHCLYGALTAATSVQEKAEVAIPTTAMSPPEGNMTFLGGTTWCVALSGVPQADLQSALDWACGLGMADCKPIRDGGACFQPDTLVSHASFAFNNYYQQNGNSDIACNFGGTAVLTKTDPSYGKCVYAASSLASSAPQRPEHDWGLFGYGLAGILLTFLLRSPRSLLL